MWTRGRFGQKVDDHESCQFGPEVDDHEVDLVSRSTFVAIKNIDHCFLFFISDYLNVHCINDLNVYFIELHLVKF